MLFIAVNAALLVATIGSGMGAQLGAARLLYAMGRERTLPTKFFGALEPRKRIPRNNVLLIGAISIAGALIMTYETGAELLNFGALLAFMGVNLSSVRHAWRFKEKGRAGLIVFGSGGFLICLLLWLNLSSLGKIARLLLGFVGNSALAEPAQSNERGRLSAIAPSLFAGIDFFVVLVLGSHPELRERCALTFDDLPMAVVGSDQVPGT